MSKESYIYRLYSPRSDYGTTPEFVTTAYEGFCSLYSVDLSTALAITDAGTCKGFKGIVWSERLWIDVDGYEKCDIVEDRLKGEGYDYVAYDTGGRGAHFGVRRDISPSHLLPLQDKAYIQEHFPEADSSIYTHLHPFRLPGTIHTRTGMPKSLVRQQAGRSLILPPYKPNTSSPKMEEGVFSGNGQSKSIFDIVFITRNSEPSKAGERHAQLVRLAYALRDNGYNINLARWWINEVNKRFQPRKEDQEIEKIIQSIYL